MNVAFLFNSDYPSLGDFYGLSVMELILETQLLQHSDCQMRVSIGDILTYGAARDSQTPTIAFLKQLCRAVYQPNSFDRLKHVQLERTHGSATVFCWLFQNMHPGMAEALNSKLFLDLAYLGAMDVNFANPLHLLFFRNLLKETYRFRGRTCSVLYQISNEDPDESLHRSIESYGFTVESEDIGARGTIFDQYDKLDHFRRIEDFKRLFHEMGIIELDEAGALALHLEELHPKLFDAFAAAARTLARAETEEDYAQAALSGRRLLEKSADYLFPPRENLWQGHEVGSNQYKNRLWAYLGQIATGELKTTLGEELDRLVNQFNSGVHANSTRAEVEQAFRSLSIWMLKVFSISPQSARQPYLPHERALLDFVDSLRAEIQDSSSD